MILFRNAWRCAILSAAGLVTLIAVIALMGAPPRALANTGFANSTATDPSNPTPCASCHYPAREGEGRNGLNPVGQAFFYQCRIKSPGDCHTLPVANTSSSPAWTGPGAQTAQSQYPATSSPAPGAPSVLSLEGRWVQASTSGGLPSDAVVGGLEGGITPLYVCHALSQDDVVPGKVVGGTCYIAVGGKEVGIHDFEVLAGRGFNRLWGDIGLPQADLFDGGAVGGQKARVCRFNLTDSGAPVGLEVGYELNGVCTVAWRGLAYTSPYFEVLHTFVTVTSGTPDTQPNAPTYPPLGAPTPVGSPQPVYQPAAAMQQARFTDTCTPAGNKDDDTYFVVYPGVQGAHEIRFFLKNGHHVSLVLPVGSTYRSRCGNWPQSDNPTRAVSF